MEISNAQKTALQNLIISGKKLKAVRYAQDEFKLTAEQALLLTEKLAEELNVSGLSSQVEQDSALKKRVTASFAGGRKFSKIIAAFFGLIGLGMLAGAVYLFTENSKFIDSAVMIEGVCFDFDTHRSTSDGSTTTMYSPLFEYEYNGQQYTHSTDVSSSSPDYEFGEVVEIYIDPNNPTDALINSFLERWFVVMILGIMGSMFTGAALLVLKLF